MKNCLDEFCNLSGQQVSFAKSRISCSNNITEAEARRIVSMCGSPLTKNLGKYLGVPLIHGRVNNHTYYELVDKTQKRLAAWKSDSLSLAGRVTLIKAVTSALPVYIMQSVKLPGDICDRLDKINRNFLWGHTEAKKTIHLINWDTVCMPKRCGGLGIKKTKDMNQALLAKVGWRLLQNENGLWCKLLSSKYLNTSSLIDIIYSKGGVCSSTWRGIRFGVKLLAKGLLWRVGRGDKIRFWVDNWVPGIGVLKDLDNISISESDVSQTVDHYMLNGEWNISQLDLVLPLDIVSRVTSIHAGGGFSGSDRLIWGWNQGGDFSVKSAYSGLAEPDCVTPWRWKFIWNLKLPPRVQHFLWLLLHGKILTNHQRAARGMDVDTSCPRCKAGIETVDHLFRDCKVSAAVWEWVCRGSTSSASFKGDIVCWFADNMQEGKIGPGNLPHYLVFTYVLWFIWKWRCNQVFDNDFVFPQLPHVVIFGAVKEWPDANVVGTCMGKRYIPVVWMPPTEEWVKLNVDGSCDQASGKITAGGVLRNHLTEWLTGFVMNKGVGNALKAELWGIFEGISLAWRSGFRCVIVETDSLDAVKLISQDSTSNHPLYSIIQSCKSLIAADWDCRVKHVFREGNRLADSLARLGHDFGYGIHFYDDPPPAIASVFAADVRGLVCARLCSSSFSS